MMRHERLQANNFKTIIFAKFEGIDFSNIPFDMVELEDKIEKLWIFLYYEICIVFRWSKVYLYIFDNDSTLSKIYK